MTTSRKIRVLYERNDSFFIIKREYRHNHVLQPNHQLLQPAIKILTLLMSPIRKCYSLMSDIYS